MEKIQELIKQGKFSKNLMEDKEFVEGAKEIFKSENIEIDDKKLAQLMDEIETKLKKDNILDNKALEEVSGGITTNAIARGVIKITTNCTGTVIGMLLGSNIGYISGITIGAKLGGENLVPAMQFAIESALNPLGGGPRRTHMKAEATGKANIGAGVGLWGGVIAGALTGSIIGCKLGSWICKKVGLEEG